MERAIYNYNDYISEIPSLEGELWMPITDGIIPNIRFGYFVSNYGRLYSIIKSSTGTGFMRPSYNGRGYRQIQLHLNDRRTVTRKVHRLVMLCFNYIYDNELYLVNHIDGIKDNNHISNLEWCTESYNTIHAIDHNLKTVFNNDYQVIEESVLDKAFIDYNNGYLPKEVCRKYDLNTTSFRLMLSGNNRSYFKEKYNLIPSKIVDDAFGQMYFTIDPIIQTMVREDIELEDIIEYIFANFKFENFQAALVNIKRRYRFHKGMMIV